MKKLLFTVLILLLTVSYVKAAAFEAPTIPESAQKYFPEEEKTFSEGLIYIIIEVLEDLRPELISAMSQCARILLIALLVGIFRNTATKTGVIDLCATVTISIVLIEPSGQLIQYTIDSVTQLCEYGKLLLPVMTAALAAQGGATTATAVCTGTLFFLSILSSLISKILIPMIYVCFCIAVTKSALGERLLEGLYNLIHWAMTWSLKIILYVFTGYLSVTGIVSGSVDAQALKATKITIAGFVPVVGKIVSDASEAILVSAGVMKNSAGIYGLLAILTLWISPFLKIGVRYLLLKITGGICEMLAPGPCGKLVKDFTSIIGVLLGITATVCVLFLVSCVCFMKGVG